MNEKAVKEGIGMTIESSAGTVHFFATVHFFVCTGFINIIHPKYTFKKGHIYIKYPDLLFYEENFKS